MMNEKDKQLQQLFDGYAESLDPRPELADRALNSMRAEKARLKKRKTALWVTFASLGSATAGALAVFGVVTALRGLRGVNTVPTVPTVPDAQPVSYKIEQIKAKRVDGAFVADYLDMSDATALGVTLFAENYYGCYFKDSGELAYVKAVFGVNTDEGNIEMCIIAEDAAYAREDLSDKRTGKRGEYVYDVEYICGEYVTSAYYFDGEYRYYVSAMGNAGDAEIYAKYFVGAGSDGKN